MVFLDLKGTAEAAPGQGPNARTLYTYYETTRSRPGLGLAYLLPGDC